MRHKSDVHYRLVSTTQRFCYESLNFISFVPEKIVHCRVKSWGLVTIEDVHCKVSLYQALAYRTRMPLHTPKTLETCKKKACLVWLRKLQGVQHIACLKQQHSLSFTFCKTQKPYEKIMCIYLLFYWFSDKNCIIRNSHWRCSILKGVLKVRKIYWKTPVPESLF